MPDTKGDECSPEQAAALLTEQVAAQVARCMLTFDETLEASLHALEPSLVVNELFSLARATSSALSQLQVKGAPVDVAHARARLFRASQQTLKFGLELLGLPALERV